MVEGPDVRIDEGHFTTSTLAGRLFLEGSLAIGCRMVPTKEFGKRSSRGWNWRGQKVGKT